MRDSPDRATARVPGEVAWLNELIEHARSVAAGGRFGIFGTSVAATWLAAGLGEAVEFFVDEDPARRGRARLGHPILAPEEVAAGAVVYLVFPPETSCTIARRPGSLPVHFAAPPPLA